MKKIICLSFFFLILPNYFFAQSLNDTFSKDKMKKDLKIFKNIRLKANSGLYKYRTVKEVDSLYLWAEQQIDKSNTYLDFYNIICQLSDFEGSLHNSDELPEKVYATLKDENTGYFPYPIKWIEGKWILNFKEGEIPLGAEIIAIDDVKISDIVQKIDKYYSTDGINKTAKMFVLSTNFSKYFRLNYGLKNSFKVSYKLHDSEKLEETVLQSVSHLISRKNFKNRYSEPDDQQFFLSYDEFKDKYSYKEINNKTAILTINTFVIGWNEQHPDHKKYVRFLDSVFVKMKDDKIDNLIVDVRNNGGGSDPNDQVTYSYLTNRRFSENKQAWISFNKVPYVKFIESKIPRFIRPLVIGKYNRALQKEFPVENNGKFYQNSGSEDQKIRTPHVNAFNGTIYLLIGPRVASAGSMFAAMVAGNENTISVGQETMGGYYGHNGHTPITYILPNSKIKTTFSIVNLEQDVPKKDNQIYNRGIMPDYNISQTYSDFIQHKDAEMQFVLDLIKKN